MILNLTSRVSGFYTTCMLLLLACNDSTNREPKTPVIEPIRAEEPAGEILRKYIANSAAYTSKDSSYISYRDVIDVFYRKNNYSFVWSKDGKWLHLSDSLIGYIDTCLNDGLFPGDYNQRLLLQLKKQSEDSVTAASKIFWAKSESLFTNTFFHIINDLKQGRLQHDTLSWRHDTSRYSFFINALNLLTKNNFQSTIDSFQPKHTAYRELKNVVDEFVSNMDTARYTYLRYPYNTKDEKDSLQFMASLRKRLIESNVFDKKIVAPDTLVFQEAIKKFQAKKSVKADGKISATLISMLNNTDVYKFSRLALTLDRYKALPDSFPKKYIWVNLPAYMMKVVSDDTTVFESKIICGKTNTPTPLLTGSISDIVIYPTWTVPTSIISKEMLPGLKKNPDYLRRKGLRLLTQKGTELDPSTISWHKYTKGIPYKIQQASGDNNALGVIKFNFKNPFDVYLHDTNQRYLFKNAMRALSHGCIRVQQWQDLANFIVRNDSLHYSQPDSLRYNSDSIVNWIAAKERHVISVKYPIPLYIRYFGCEEKEGKVKFYDDMYALDRKLIEKYFLNSTLR